MSTICVTIPNEYFSFVYLFIYLKKGISVTSANIKYSKETALRSRTKDLPNSTSSPCRSSPTMDISRVMLAYLIAYVSALCITFGNFVTFIILCINDFTMFNLIGAFVCFAFLPLFAFLAYYRYVTYTDYNKYFRPVVVIRE